MKKVLRVWAAGPWAGCDRTGEVELPDNWDSLTPEQQTEVREKLTLEWFWEAGFECGSYVEDGEWCS